MTKRSTPWKRHKSTTLHSSDDCCWADTGADRTATKNTPARDRGPTKLNAVNVVPLELGATCVFDTSPQVQVGADLILN